MFFKRRPHASSRIGVALHPEGVSLAHLAARETPPRLIESAFEACAPGERAGALRALGRRLRVAGIPCVCVLEPGMANVLRVEAPDVPPDEIRAAVRWRVKDMLDYHIDDAVLDVFDVPGQKVRGPGRVMYVVAARRALIEGTVAAVEDAGLALEAIDIPEMAQRNVAARLPEDAAGVATLSLSRAGGLVTLTQDHTLYLARTLEFGLNDLDAEGQGGMALEQLVLEVQRSLDYYESHFTQPPIGRVVIAPAEADTGGVLTAMAANLAVPVRAFALDEVVHMEHAPAPAEQARCVAAVGGALRNEARVL